MRADRVCHLADAAVQSSTLEMPRSSLGKRGIHQVENQNGNPENKQDDLARKSFKTGQVVPQDGIYRVTHADHRLPHEVTLLRAQEFPPCSKCGNEVNFKLLRGVKVGNFNVTLNSLPEITNANGQCFKKAG